jgi:hypothetical protein
MRSRAELHLLSSQELPDSRDALNDILLFDQIAHPEATRLSGLKLFAPANIDPIVKENLNPDLLLALLVLLQKLAEVNHRKVSSHGLAEGNPLFLEQIANQFSR